MASFETPAERISRLGIQTVSPIDLLAVALSRRETDLAGAENSARIILEPGIGQLGDLSHSRLEQTAGFSHFESTKFLATMELGRRFALIQKGPATEVNNPDAVAALFEHIRNERQEHFCAAYLDAKSKVISQKTIHVGTLTMSVVGPREVFREAVREGAASLVVAHNHPSGDPTPSPEDISVTRTLAEVGRMLDIELLDHVVIGHNGYVSLKQRGLF
jgi:DNA repair protein RadC